MPGKNSASETRLAAVRREEELRGASDGDMAGEAASVLRAVCEESDGIGGDGFSSPE